MKTDKRNKMRFKRMDKVQLMNYIIVYLLGALSATTIISLLELYSYFEMRGTLEYFFEDFYFEGKSSRCPPASTSAS